jgi:O-6-methylguanine DNA methyltransferase
LKKNKLTPLDKKYLRGLTNFEKKVLRITSHIPLGQTRSYQWVAKRIGSPKAVRAVGQALKKNPYPIIIPCHRVIKSNGSLGGYAKGKKLKSKLLLLEKYIAEIIK